MTKTNKRKQAIHVELPVKPEIADKLMTLITQHGNERLDEGYFNENEEKKNIAIDNGLKLRWEIEKILREQFSV